MIREQRGISCLLHLSLPLSLSRSRSLWLSLAECWRASYGVKEPNAIVNRIGNTAKAPKREILSKKLRISVRLPLRLPSPDSSRSPATGRSAATENRGTSRVRRTSDAQHVSGYTAMHLAARAGCVELVPRCCRRGPRVIRWRQTVQPRSTGQISAAQNRCRLIAAGSRFSTFVAISITDFRQINRAVARWPKQANSVTDVIQDLYGSPVFRWLTTGCRSVAHMNHTFHLTWFVLQRRTLQRSSPPLRQLCLWTVPQTVLRKGSLTTRTMLSLCRASSSPALQGQVACCTWTQAWSTA